MALMLLIEVYRVACSIVGLTILQMQENITRYREILLHIVSFRGKLLELLRVSQLTPIYP